MRQVWRIRACPVMGARSGAGCGLQGRDAVASAPAEEGLTRRYANHEKSPSYGSQCSIKSLSGISERNLCHDLHCSTAALARRARQLLSRLPLPRPGHHQVLGRRHDRASLVGFRLPAMRRCLGQGSGGHTAVAGSANGLPQARLCHIGCRGELYLLLAPTY